MYNPDNVVDGSLDNVAQEAPECLCAINNLKKTEIENHAYSCWGLAHTALRVLRLRLSRNPITGQGDHCIATAVAELPNLHSVVLNLHHCRISNKGKKTDSSGLAPLNKAPKLHTLSPHLSHNAMSMDRMERSMNWTLMLRRPCTWHT